MQHAVILGIDPGLQATGYGVLSAHNGNISVIDSGCVHLKKTDTLQQRLISLYDAAIALQQRYQPTHVAIENVFVKSFPKSALYLGHARGALMVAFRSLVLFEYTPAQVKKTLCNNGRATKDQMRHAAKMMLNMPHLPQSDEADALAVAWCCTIQTCV
jgi:crossover junction endodeoxyribonuclease RuvC